MNASVYSEMCAQVKKQRPRSLTVEENLDIVRVCLQLRMEQVSSVEGVAKVDVCQRTATLLGRARNTVQAVWREFVSSRQVPSKRPTGNQIGRSSRISRNPILIASIQKFVRDRRAIRQRTVARHVMEFLVMDGHLTVDMDDEKAIPCGLRCVQRYLKNLGYQRGTKKGSKSLALSEKNKIARDKYVYEMCSNLVQVNVTLRQPVVYLDESYIHQKLCSSRRFPF